MIDKEKIINRLTDDILSRDNLTSTDRDDIVSLKEELEAINYTRCCETVKDKYTHTIEVDLNSKKMQEQCNKQLEQIHNAPTRLFLYDSKKDEYIELKP